MKDRHRDTDRETEGQTERKRQRDRDAERKRVLCSETSKQDPRGVDRRKYRLSLLP